MREVKIAERIIVDEPENVVSAIYNMCGKKIDFELVQKFITNERNTIFYLDKKLNSSTKPGNYQDYVWLDTGFRDYFNHSIMICLHYCSDGYVGYYTGTVRELANRVKTFNKKNVRDIEKNYSRFLTKYNTRSKEREVVFIEDEMRYVMEVVNKEVLKDPETAFASAIKRLDIELAEELTEEIEQVVIEEEPEEFSPIEKQMTFDLMFEQMEKMQVCIDKLLEDIESNKKKSKEENELLQAQNKEYKRAIVQMRTFAQLEEKGESTLDLKRQISSLLLIMTKSKMQEVEFTVVEDLRL